MATLPSAPLVDEHVLLEIVGVYGAHEATRPGLLAKLLSAGDPRVRPYGTRVVGNWVDTLQDAVQLLREHVRDENPRVLLEAVVAASCLNRLEAAEIITQALDAPRDAFLDYALPQSARSAQARRAPCGVSPAALHPGRAIFARSHGLREGVPAVSCCTGSTDPSTSKGSPSCRPIRSRCRPWRDLRINSWPTCCPTSGPTSLRRRPQ